jgi:peptidoglycan hydrolase-like protein with peptidoglycan-binding domain
MDWLKLLPVIFSLVDVVPKIQEAIRTGGSVIDLVKRFVPEIIPYLQQLGTSLFPQVTDPQNAISAAIDVLADKDGTKWVQNSLNTLGQAPALDADGIYGKLTKAAVAAYQTKKGLKADGWSGPLTSAALAQDVALATSPTLGADPVTQLQTSAK